MPRISPASKVAPGCLMSLNGTILLSNERHVHFHDLDLREWLTGFYMFAIFDSKFHQFTRAWGSQLGRVILFLK
jgi:hypothetical protein